MVRLISLLSVLAWLIGCADWKMLNSDTVVADDVAARLASRPNPTDWQQATFGVLADFPGRTFRGEPSDNSSETQADIQSWAWALGGAGLSVTHALEDGTYGGETLIYQDKSSDALAYVYVTNAGFRTEGTFTLGDDGTWEAIEAVQGHETITKVRSRGRVRADDALVMQSDYLSEGEWEPGHGFVYREVFDEMPNLNKPE
ncbi:MAG: hypothetical protein AAGK23_07030 [Pseudomonadota bacterium]